jgi:hypothetical protein
MQQLAQPCPGEAAQAHRLDRLGAERVGVGDRQPKEMPHRGKAGNLPPSVRQQLEQLGGAAGDVEEAVRRLGFLDEGATGRDLRHDGGGGQPAEVFVGNRIAYAQRTCVAVCAWIRPAARIEHDRAGLEDNH